MDTYAAEWQRGMYGRKVRDPLRVYTIFKVLKVEDRYLRVVYYHESFKSFDSDDSSIMVLKTEVDLVPLEQVIALGIAPAEVRRLKVFSFASIAAVVALLLLWVAMNVSSLQNEAISRKATATPKVLLTRNAVANSKVKQDATPTVAADSKLYPTPTISPDKALVSVNIVVVGDSPCPKQAPRLLRLSYSDAVKVVQDLTVKTPPAWFAPSALQNGTTIIDGIPSDNATNRPFCPTVWLSVHVGHLSKVYCKLQTLEGYYNFEEPVECPILLKPGE